jgi:mannose-1-phosphate guanylyltransferase/MurNAc alpha-1-phosphate uridylyltransferase
MCVVVLAAGEGRRLRPLTELLPKALCPVGNIPLLDRALERVAAAGLSGPADVAVNAAYLAELVAEAAQGRAYVSREPGGPLGTSGGVGNLKAWIAGRGVLVGNSDAYLSDPRRAPGEDIGALLDGWSGETVRLLTLPNRPGETGGFSGRRFAGFSLIPWRYIRDLPAEPGDLVGTVWRTAESAGELELIGYQGVYLDTGTPADYLRANLHAAAGASIIDPSATVTAEVTNSVIGAKAEVHAPIARCVIWPGSTVAPAEHLIDTIRAGTLTITAAPIA